MVLKFGNFYRFTTYQDARRVGLVDVDGLKTIILRVSPVKVIFVSRCDPHGRFTVSS